MVGHDHPRVESIALPVEVQECILDDARGARVSERQLARTGVEIGLDALAQLSLSAGLTEMAELAAPLLEALGGQESAVRKVRVWVTAPPSK